jgi:hypothetical protein
LIDGVVGTCNVTQNLTQPVVQQSGAPADVVKLYGAGAPAASLGANHANTGSEYVDTTNGKLYINSGSKASPSWRIVTSA